MRPMKILSSLIILPTFSVLVSCSNPPKPEPAARQAHDPLAAYPHELYITFIGSGDTQAAAEKNAIAGIAQSIQVDVNSQQQLIEQYFESGPELQLKQMATFSREIGLKTEQNLKNINIGKTWFSQEDGRYNALAYMDRSGTARIYDRELEEIDKDVSYYFQKSQQNENKLTRLAYLNKAFSLAVQRDIMAEQLNTITLGAERFSPTVAMAELTSARQESTGTVDVQLRLDCGNHDDLCSAVRQVLQTFGFKTVDDRADVLVIGQWTLQHLQREGFFVRWHIDLHFQDTSTGKVFLTYSAEDREGHTSYAEAERRATTRAAAEIRIQLYAKIDDYFDSLLAEK